MTVNMIFEYAIFRGGIVIRMRKKDPSSPVESAHGFPLAVIKRGQHPRGAVLAAARHFLISAFDS